MPADSTVGTSRWIRSSACVGESHCVEVANIDGGVAIRDSKTPDVALIFDKTVWRNFIAAIKDGGNVN